MSDHYFKQIGALTIQWELMEDKRGFIVSVSYAGINLGKNQIIDENNPNYPFAYIPPGENEYAARGLLSYCEGPNGVPELDLALSAPLEEKIRLYPAGPVPPIPPGPPFPPGDETLDNIILSDIRHRDLFPYVYISPWPQISAHDLQTRFVSYDKNSSADPSLKLLYENLVKEKQKQERLDMENEAVYFIEGKTPYENQFISRILQFTTIMNTYLSIYQELHRHTVIDFKTLDGIVRRKIGSWEIVKQDIQQQDYINEKEQAWESVFALVITAGYRHLLLDNLIKTVITANLIELTAANLPPEPEPPGNTEQEGKEPDDGSAEEGNPPLLQLVIDNDDIGRLANATVILPAEVFPLPAYTGVVVPANRKEFVQPYAIGQLVMVRHRLKRYLLGEISWVENVMRGERKEVTQRSLNRVKESDTESRTQAGEKVEEAQFLGKDLMNEVTRTLCQRSATTTYNDSGTGAGASGSTIGGWTVTEDPTGRQQGISTFGKEIVSKTVDRIARTINHTRSVTVLNENEETVVHHYDNSNSPVNMLGIYRWLNKLYSLHTVVTGNRLVLELSIDRPAAQYLENERHFQEVQLCEPVPPEKLGLTSYREIISDSAQQDNPLYYANLLTRYDAGEVIPPPPQSQTLSVVLESVKSYSTRTVELTPGYEAQSAVISIVFLEPAVAGTALVVVGEKNLSYNSKSGEAQTLTLTADLLRATLPISIMASGAGIGQEAPSEPSGALEICPQVITPGYIATIAIQCRRTAQALEQWQIKTYQQVLRSYDKQRDTYYSQVKGQQQGLVSADPLVNREIEYREVKQNVLRLLRELYFKLVGEEPEQPGTVPQGRLNEPRYQQFFQNMVKWDEMTYQFVSDCCTLSDETGGASVSPLSLPSPGSEDKSFNQFLRADYARVLLPIKVELARTFLYFMSTGDLWAGDNQLVPVIDTDTDLSIVNELKALSAAEHGPGPGNPGPLPVKEEWEVIVPTSMVVLQQDAKFPEFNDKQWH
jgi:hypothetical protein